MMETGFSEKISDKVKEDIFGQMDQFMKAGGKIIRLMEKEGSFMQMVMCTMASG